MSWTTIASPSGSQLAVKTVRVEVIEGPDTGSVVASDGEPVLLGTADQGDLKLSDRTVSRCHVEVSATDDGILVRDLGSKNGTVIGDVCVRDALSLALRLLTTSDDDAESPRALLGDHGHHLFAHPDSRLTLLGRGSVTPRAEKPAHAWIFVLRIPALSDHIFYAVIGRQRDYRGRMHGYTYGFN